MNLILDIGNSFTKIAVFKGHHMLFKTVCKQDVVLEVLLNIDLEFPEIKACIVASVKDKEPILIDYLAGHFNLIEFDDKTPLPILNNYGSPKTLGPDRLAAVVGATLHFPKCNALVVDVGTCVTYDLINDQGTYLGGAIAPGLDMRLKALNTFTSKLPLVPVSPAYHTLIGTTTETCILSGVQMGMLFEMEGALQAYSDQFESLQVLLTGGQYDFFVKQLKNRIFAAPDLVLEGLNIILNYNASK